MRVQIPTELQLAICGALAQTNGWAGLAVSRAWRLETLGAARAYIRARGAAIRAYSDASARLRDWLDPSAATAVASYRACEVDVAQAEARLNAFPQRFARATAGVRAELGRLHVDSPPGAHIVELMLAAPWAPGEGDAEHDLPRPQQAYSVNRYGPARWAASHGHLALARRLGAHAPLGTLLGPGSPLAAAARRGHWAAVLWLAERRLTARPCRASHDSKVRNAIDRQLLTALRVTRGRGQWELAVRLKYMLAQTAFPDAILPSLMREEAKKYAASVPRGPCFEID